MGGGTPDRGKRESCDKRNRYRKGQLLTLGTDQAYFPMFYHANCQEVTGCVPWLATPPPESSAMFSVPPHRAGSDDSHWMANAVRHAFGGLERGGIGGTCHSFCLCPEGLAHFTAGEKSCGWVRTILRRDRAKKNIWSPLALEELQPGLNLPKIPSYPNSNQSQSPWSADKRWHSLRAHRVLLWGQGAGLIHHCIPHWAECTIHSRLSIHMWPQIYTACSASHGGIKTRCCHPFHSTKAFNLSGLIPSGIYFMSWCSRNTQHKHLHF